MIDRPSTTISRRGMIKGGMAAAAAMTAYQLTPFLGAHAGAQTASGGTLITTFYPSTANPWTSTGTAVWHAQLFESLVALDQTLTQPLPALAETWDLSDDSLTYTFHLRSGVTWHDGQPFTSADVLWSYQTLLHPDVGGILPPNLASVKGATAYKAGEATDIPGLEAPDDQTLKVTLEAPSPLLLQQLATIYILPKHLLGEVKPSALPDDPYFRESLVGLGPFKFKELQMDQFISAVRNDGYYRGAPLLDGIIGKKVDEPSVRILSQEQNELDIIGLQTPDDIAHVQANDQLSVFPGLPIIGNFFESGMKPEILSDERVRQAILYAIDRETLANALWKGTVSLINSPFVVSWVPLDGLNAYAYDPEKAKSLLAEAGWKSDDELEIWAYYTDQFTGQLLAAFQQYLGDAGMKVKIRQAEWSELEPEYNTRNFGLLYGGGTIGPDPDNTRLYFHSKSSFNTQYRDETVDRLYDEGLATLDQTQRATIYSELAARLNELSWWMMLWTPPRYLSVSKTVSDLTEWIGPSPYHISFYTGSETWSKQG